MEDRQSRFKDFTDEEVFLMCRALSEFMIMFGERYSQEERDLQNKLFNELAEEDNNRYKRKQKKI